MQRVLSSDLWKTIRTRARRVRCRRAVIAYVTQDLVGFRKGDTLVVDASTYAVRNGETNAKLLTKLHKKGVMLYDCPRLHAKMLLLDDVVVIGSGNMSNSSASGLVEAGVISDHSSTVAGIASLIEQIVSQSKKLDAKSLASLRKIKVIRRSGPHTSEHKRRKPKIAELGNRTWLVGVTEIVTTQADEQRVVDRAIKALRPIMRDPDEEPDWIRWHGKTRFTLECREGDSIIRIWTSHKAKRPSTVMRSAPVLLKQRGTRRTHFFLGTPSSPHAELSWGKFQKLFAKAGGIGRIKPGGVRVLEPEVAEALARKWKQAARYQ
jgi:PLD-like domain